MRILSLLMVLLTLAVTATTPGRPEETTERCQLGTVNIPASAQECDRIKAARLPYEENKT